MAETITLSVTGGGTFTLFEQPLRASVAAPVFDIELSESVEAIGKVVQSRAVEIAGQVNLQFGPDASALVTRTAQLETDVDFFVSGVETQSREIRITQSTEAQFAGAEVKSRRTNIEGEATLDIRNSATSPIESRRATMTTNVDVVPVDASTRSGEFDIATAAAVDARGVTVEARDAQITGVFATQFERDTTPPEVTDSNYNSGTKTLTTSITEESSQVTVYWASVANPNTVTKTEIRDNTGDTIEAGSFVALSGDDSNTITLTDPTADEIHFFTVDPVGNEQVDIEIVTGIVVDDLQSREIQATSAAVLNAVGSQVEARDAQIAGSAVLNMEGSDVASAFVLDDYPGSVGAWSLRKLSSSTTNVARLRNTNSQTEQDFTADEITDGTLASFAAGGDDVKVVTMYDQSGNGNNLTQSVALDQPFVVEGGTINLMNGRAVARYNGFSQFLEMAGQLITTNTWHMFCHFYKPVGATSGPSLLSQHLLGAAGRVMFLRDNADTLGIFLNNGTTFSVASSISIAEGVAQVGESRAVSNDYAVAKDGGAFETVISGEALTPLNEPFRVGAHDGGTDGHWDGRIGDVIVYDSDQTSNRAAIVSDIENA